jgi:hypothetical protein
MRHEVQESRKRARLHAPLDQPRQLLARIAADALQKAQHHRLLSALQIHIGEAAQGAADAGISFSRGKPPLDRRRAVQESLKLLQGL